MSDGCGPLKMTSIKNTITTHATAAMIHLGIGDFDFLPEAALGEAEVCFRGEGFCGVAACGVVTLTWGVADGGGAKGGTAKLALQAGHSMV